MAARRSHRVPRWCLAINATVGRTRQIGVDATALEGGPIVGRGELWKGLAEWFPAVDA